MSDTMHKMTILNMVERDIENKYAYIKEHTMQLLYSLSNSLPLLSIALPSAEKWIKDKEKQYLPMVQHIVNINVDICFEDEDVTIDDAYINAKTLINNSLDELIKLKINLNLESVDQILQVLIGTKLSL